MLLPGDDESSKDKNEARIKPPSYKEFGTTNRHTEKQTESYMKLQLKKTIMKSVQHFLKWTEIKLRICGMRKV
jgi:hypothetical protein